LIEQTLDFITACVSWIHVYPARNFIGTENKVQIAGIIESAIKQFDFSWQRRPECGDSTKSF